MSVGCFVELTVTYCSFKGYRIFQYKILLTNKTFVELETKSLTKISVFFSVFTEVKIISLNNIRTVLLKTCFLSKCIDSYLVIRFQYRYG